MREWTDIVAAYDLLKAQGRPASLATVVRVEGSAYRRPGARMLVAEDGQTWGGVSGGCLERDVAERARGVVATGRPFLQRYDTSDEELIERGVSTGCGGTIDVLLQPLSPDNDAPLAGLLRVIRANTPARIVTVIEANGVLRPWFGRTFHPSEAGLPSALASAAGETAADRRWQHRLASTLDGKATLFVERLSPPQRLVIVGGGPDAVPVVAIAKTLGWRVAVVAARPALLLESRFAAADERYVTGADAPLHGVPITAECAVVVMTHNITRDATVMSAITVRPRYLGLLGPRQRTQRVIDPLPPRHPARALHSPVGLDIGSESPEEIALSIIAEVQAYIRGADARPMHVRPIPTDVTCQI